MRLVLVLAIATAGLMPAAASAGEIFRCGSVYRSDVSASEARARGCVRVAPKQLTRAESDQYNACRIDAAKAPTEIGVQAGLRVCREKYEQAQ